MTNDYQLPGVRLVGYQPQYFPRLHYYARILNTDIFKISDNLQYVRRHSYPTKDGTAYNGPSYQAHTPIKTSQGIHLLDMPVRHLGAQNARTMNTVELDYSDEWSKKHLRNIELSYGKAPNFKSLYPSLTLLLGVEYGSLAACTVASTLWGLAVLFELPLLTLETFALPTINELLPVAGTRLKKIVRMSEAGIPPADKAGEEDVNDWIIANCREFGANEYYYGGTAASSYINKERIQAAGITLIQQDWQCAQYPQCFPKRAFIPNLSIIDLLMNVPPDEARRILSTPNQV